MSEPLNPRNALPNPSRDRVRRCRDRRKNELRVVPVEIRDIEIAALVACGYLEDGNRHNPPAIGDAIGRLLDQLPPTQWPTHERKESPL